MTAEELRAQIKEVEALKDRLLDSFDNQEKISEYNNQISALKEELNNITVEALKNELLKTGVLNQKKIEETLAANGIESIELSDEAKEIQKHQKKVNSVFDKYIGKQNG